MLYTPCTASRLYDFVLYTTDTMPSRDEPSPSPEDSTSTICARYEGTAPTGVTSIPCDDVMLGRFVVIQIPGRSACLTLCEVEVYGM